MREHDVYVCHVCVCVDEHEQHIPDHQSHILGQKNKSRWLCAYININTTFICCSLFAVRDEDNCVGLQRA